jgi:hypothetical protein
MRVCKRTAFSLICKLLQCIVHMAPIGSALDHRFIPVSHFNKFVSKQLCFRGCLDLSFRDALIREQKVLLDCILHLEITYKAKKV